MNESVNTRVAVIIGSLANLATLTWAGLAVFVSGRGLGLANEGYYLLAYANWDRDRRTFSGAQYLFGPLFDLLHHDIAALRVVRLVLVLTIHLFFATAFARWLRLQRPHAPAGRAWAYCIVSVIVSSAAIEYSWLPPTPGYNEVTLLGSIAMVGLLLVGLRAAQAGGAAPWWIGVTWGLVAGAMMLARPPIVVSVLLITLVSAYLLHRARGSLMWFAATVTAGILLFAVLVQGAVASWSDILPPLADQLGVVAASSHSPTQTLGWYASSSLTLARAVVVVCAPTVLVGSLLLMLPSLSPARRAAIVLSGLVGSVALLTGGGGLHAGGGNVLAFTSGVVAMLVLVVGSCTKALRVLKSRTAVVGVVGLLALTPVLQGLGTNNALYATAVNGSACWVALMVLLVTWSGVQPTPRSILSAVATLMAVLLTIIVGINGITHDAAGHSLVSGPMARVAGSREVTVRLPAYEASRYSTLRRELGIGPNTHRPMLAFGELAQYVLVLGGVPIGEAWYSSFDDGLNAADLRAACRHGNPWGQDQPLVVANRDLSPEELAAWRACDVDFATEYVDVTPPATPDDVRILRRQPPGASGTETLALPMTLP